MYAHFSGAQPRARQARTATSRIYWFDHGWFWFIPLADGATSVGAVVWPNYMKSRKRSVREFFLSSHCAVSAAGGALERRELISEVEATGNYSYACDRSARRELSAGRRRLCVHRSGVLLRRDAGDEQRRQRRPRPFMPAATAGTRTPR